ncbi:MAG TPA: hypothetical protein PKW90_22995, partial [Myxococcota bacterium]|nr:hypothetical protein [Myxococcota bacterium]
SVPGATLLRGAVTELNPQGAVVEVVFRTRPEDDGVFTDREQVLLALLGRLQGEGILLVREV